MTYEEASRNIKTTEIFILIFVMDFITIDIGKTNRTISTSIFEAA
jgi:hypothetical protein